MGASQPRNPNIDVILFAYVTAWGERYLVTFNSAYWQWSKNSAHFIVCNK